MGAWRFGLAAAVLVLAGGCGDGISSGTVTRKEYTAAHDVVRQQCGAYSSKGACVVYVPVRDHYPARYRLYVREGGKRGWVDVDPVTFQRYDVGGHYPDTR